MWQFTKKKGPKLGHEKGCPGGERSWAPIGNYGDRIVKSQCFQEGVLMQETQAYQMELGWPMKIQMEAMVWYPVEEVAWDKAFQRVDMVITASWNSETQ